MKRIVYAIIIAVVTFLFSSCEIICDHNYILIDKTESTCMKVGYSLYQCEGCGDLIKEDDTEAGEHIYFDEISCHDKKCIVEGCSYIKEASAQHRYTDRYICAECDSTIDCTLQTLARDYGTQLLEQARKNSGTMQGSFEVVVLDAENTVLNIQNYITNPDIDTSKVTGGLFVKFNTSITPESAPITIYYNFALQFCEEQTRDMAFSYTGSEEIWYLEVVDGNKTILFEYSIS